MQINSYYFYAPSGCSIPLKNLNSLIKAFKVARSNSHLHHTVIFYCAVCRGKWFWFLKTFLSTLGLSTGHLQGASHGPFVHLRLALFTTKYRNHLLEKARKPNTLVRVDSSRDGQPIQARLSILRWEAESKNGLGDNWFSNFHCAYDLAVSMSPVIFFFSFFGLLRL